MPSMLPKQIKFTLEGVIIEYDSSWATPQGLYPLRITIHEGFLKDNTYIIHIPKDEFDTILADLKKHNMVKYS